LDARPAAECRKVTLTEARAEAIRLLAIGGGALSNCSARRAKAAAAKAGGTELATAAAPAATVWCRDVRTMLEFHWPDSGLGRWGEPHTFLQMLPAMRPQRLPAGCRVVVTTLLRQPARLYPSLQLHQFPSMRGYNDAASNLSACDYAGFVAAFPNFQGWRLTSAEWSPLPLSAVPHAAMLAVTTRLLSRFDLVGVTGRMADWLMLLCARAVIVPCPAVKHLNADRRSRDGAYATSQCAPPRAVNLEAAVWQHALADLKLHDWAAARLDEEMARFRRRAAAGSKRAQRLLYSKETIRYVK
jgi:hypothetical protein